MKALIGQARGHFEDLLLSSRTVRPVVEEGGCSSAQSAGLAARLFIGAVRPRQGGSQSDQVGDLLGQAG
jgi:hypothetical protein